MGKDTKQRQDKLAAKKSRRKRRLIAKGGAENLGSKLQRAEKWPVVSTVVSGSIFETGMGTVVLTRESPNGVAAVAHFLIDAWCLGVKDAFVKTVTRETAAAMASELSRKAGPIQKVTPEYAKKLVVRSVEYASSLGILPAPEFAQCFSLFQGIDESLCQNEFQFGRDSKPVFFSGPNDTPAFVRKIMGILQKSRGQDNFDFMLRATSDDLELLGIDDESLESISDRKETKWMIDGPEGDSDEDELEAGEDEV